MLLSLVASVFAVIIINPANNRKYAMAPRIPPRNGVLINQII
jgi:hypothetical protein